MARRRRNGSDRRPPSNNPGGTSTRGTTADRGDEELTSQVAAGVQLFYLSRIMGTSVTQIDATYGHLVPDSEEYLRGPPSTLTTRMPQKQQRDAQDE